ncbi:MAG: HlyD family secretion protein [Variibacter sp.]
MTVALSTVTLRAVALVAALALGACSNKVEQDFQGWVEADLVFSGPDDPGRVETLAVREGDTVKEGAPLYTVDADLQKADLAANEAAVAEAKARLARAEAQQQRPAEVAVLESQQERAEAALTLSTQELQRQRTLAEKGFTPKAQLDTAQSNYNRDKAALEEIKRQINVARLSSREEDIAAARQALAAADARLRASQTRLTRRAMKSPVAGTVQEIYFRPGEMVPAGRPVLSLLPPGNIKLRFFVAQATLPSVKIGDAVRVRCDGCAADIPARVSFIAQKAEYTPPVVYTLEERAKLVFLVEARPDDPGPLRVGQPVRVTLATAGTGR